MSFTCLSWCPAILVLSMINLPALPPVQSLGGTPVAGHIPCSWPRPGESSATCPPSSRVRVARSGKPSVLGRMLTTNFLTSPSIRRFSLGPAAAAVIPHLPQLYTISTRVSYTHISVSSVSSVFLHPAGQTLVLLLRFVTSAPRQEIRGSCAGLVGGWPGLSPATSLPGCPDLAHMVRCLPSEIMTRTNTLPYTASDGLLV